VVTEHQIAMKPDEAISYVSMKSMNDKRTTTSD